MAKDRLVIVGGGGAGDSAAFALRKSGWDGDITILSADGDRPYDRPYLSKEYLRGEVELAKVYLHPESEYEANRIELRLDTRVVGGSLAEKRLELEAGSPVDFDLLLLATGGTPRSLDGVPRASNVFTLRSLADSGAIRDALAPTGRLLLVGAGFIGAEVGASARALGRDVLMVEAAPVPLARALGAEVGAAYASIHSSKGVDVRMATKITDWHSDGGRVTGVTLGDGRREEVDVVLLGVGIDPNLALPKALGLPIDEAGGVVVDAALQAAPGVFVGGDIASHPHPILGRSIRVEHWEVAKGHGKGIARAIGGDSKPYATLPYFWSDQYDVSMEYRGQASGEHQQVWRGDRDGLKFSVFYLHNGIVDAVLSMNDGETNKAGAELIKSRAKVDQAALSDTATKIDA